jgi:hypothetical protein
VGILSILSPGSACLLTDHEEIRVQIKNFGDNPFAYQDISVVASVDAGIPITMKIGSSQLLNQGDTLEYIFEVPFDFSGEGDHQITAYSIYGQDADPLNDTLDRIVTHFGVPEPELGGVNDTLGTPLPLSLDAGGDFDTYLWNGVPGDRTYNATQYGWYTVEVSVPGGCSGKDSIFLMLNTMVEDLLLPGELKIYPVPASQYLHIEYGYKDADNLVLDIIDSNGRKVLMKQFHNATEITETIEVTGMAKGIYYMRLRSDERQLVRKIAIH